MIRADVLSRRVRYLDESSQAEVCNFDDIVVAHKHVARRQVPVDVILTLQVRHASSDLSAHVDQDLQLQITTLA